MLLSLHLFRTSLLRLSLPPPLSLNLDLLPLRQKLQQRQQQQQSRPLPQRPAVILCFGDSLTEGTLGADWVARLGDSLAGSFGNGARVVNAGVSGQLAAAVASRVERCVAACSGRVAGVLVMAGTNDVLAACAGKANRRRRRSGNGGGGGGAGAARKKKKQKRDERAAPGLLPSSSSPSSSSSSLLSSLFFPGAAARRSLLGSLVRFGYRATNALPRAPLTRPAALAAIAAALDAAARAAPGAALAVATVPPLGEEDLSSRANAAVRDLNRGIRCVASARPRVSLLDVHAALSAALAAKREEGAAASRSSSAAVEAAADENAAASEEKEEEEEEGEEEDIYLSVGPACLASVLLRIFFRISWDRTAQWKALPSAAAAAARSLPQRVSSSLPGPWRSSNSAAAAPSKGRSNKASFSPNSLLHDGVHFGETAAACVLALALPWARRAAREKGGAGASFSSSSSSSAAAPRGGAAGAGLAAALSLAPSPPRGRRRGAVVAASTSRSVAAVAVPSAPLENSSEGNSSKSSDRKGGISGALASAAIRLLASSR